MAFVHLGELEKAKVFPARCRRFLRQLVRQCQTVVSGQSQGFSNSLPPLPAAVNDAMPTGRAWTKPFVAIEPAAREKQLVAQGEANCDTDCSMRI